MVDQILWKDCKEVSLLKVTKDRKLWRATIAHILKRDTAHREAKKSYIWRVYHKSNEKYAFKVSSQVRVEGKT